MIRGLEHFKEHFRKHAENFILVGGVASHLLLEEAGASKLRPTKDLDIVLAMKPDDEFLGAIRDYIRRGGYEIQKGKKNQAIFYRFQKPKDERFPAMLELFSAAAEGIDFSEDQRIIPIADSAGAKSLSAILLDPDYFAIIRKNAVEKDGIFIINEMALIPCKAKAYLDIRGRGEDSKSWKKHRADIINLAVNFLTEESKESLSGKVRDHFLDFMNQIKEELTIEIITGACNQDVAPETLIDLLEKTFLSDSEVS
ncbi:MAG: hypothetical protein KF865_01140 [Bdellovibrionaceae bacterium]|nr:hypothetical protein [Pseudobdellovibrionaceae bacterium]